MHSINTPLEPHCKRLLNDVPAPRATTHNSYRLWRKQPRQVSHKSVPAFSCTQRSEQVTADDVTLDFRCAIPNSFDAGITPEPFKRIVIHQPHTTVNLYILVYYIIQRF